MSPQLCAHCRYRPVREQTWGGPPARYCSDKCRDAAHTTRQYREAVELLNELRGQLGMPTGGGTLRTAELRSILGQIRATLEIDDPSGHRGGRRIWAPHGTHKRYKQGCRKPCCQEVENAYRRNLRKRRSTEQSSISTVNPLATPQADRQQWTEKSTARGPT